MNASTIYMYSVYTPELKIAAGHWPFSMQFTALVVKKIDHDCIKVMQMAGQNFSSASQAQNLTFSSAPTVGGIRREVPLQGAKGSPVELYEDRGKGGEDGGGGQDRQERIGEDWWVESSLA